MNGIPAPTTGDRVRSAWSDPGPVAPVGAFLREAMYECERYQDLGYTDSTGQHLAGDHNCGVRLLEAPKVELVK